MSDNSELLKMAKDRAQMMPEDDRDLVLALIAENERVKARLCMCRDCAGQGEVYSGHSTYQGQFQPPEPDMDVCGTCGGDGVLGTLEDFEALAAERDQLKAENEELRAQIQRSQIVELANFDWDAEMTALRKNSDRYEFLRRLPDGAAEKYLGFANEDVTSQMIDEALDKGEQP